MAKKSKLESRKIRHQRLRKRVQGNPERPRLVVYRSTNHIYVQVIDDLAQKTLASASDLAGKADKAVSGAKKDRAKAVGTDIAKRCIEKGIKQVVFDRGGYKYHGRVSAVADGAREAGLEF